MKVSEYANDVNLSVAEILKKCHELAINVNNKDDYLTDDDIIMLDNTINLISTDDEITFEEEEDIEDKVDEIMTSSRVDKSMKDSISKEKLKKKDASKQDFNLKKKEMYKHKNKLMKNETDENIVLYKNGMSVAEFANVLNVGGAEIIKKLMENGLMLSLNQPIDFENAEIIALDYKKTLKREETQDVTNFESYEIIDKEEDLVKRPPIVTIMGHVDHGKTTLLDYIRNTHVVDKEFGGITQHIGAYQTKYKDELITFIDTPGHAAFTEMRARGASVTDIVIIIVAADDGVKPQTKEAVDHALSANVPIIVAVNKIDKPDANIDRVLTEMAEIGITPEAWGGDTPFINISAHTGEGVELLLETILTIAEVNELKANPNRYAVGAVIESRLDKNVGGVASFLIQNGTLRLGDPIVVGTSYAKVRTMKNDRGESIVLAGPSTPVEITGLTENPSAGDKFMAFETEAEAKAVAQKRHDAAKMNAGKDKKVSLDDLFASVDAGNKEINVVLKADVRGSEEAVKNALEKIKEKDVSVKVIRSGIGAISESDVVLASASNAIIIGFNVVASNNAKDIAKDNNIDIRLYTIIYKLVEDIEAAINGMLDPEYEEKVLGSAEVRKIFKFSKIGNIAGSYITSGIVKNGAMARVIRDGVVIASDEVIASLQREKDTVKEVKKGFECGITLEKFNDFKEGDTIEAYEMVEVKHA
ncbi:translation initiation factor IF-2 [Firmicutes bacterium CAG:460]|jgi:translation initiation factor IF-2|nr:translation initiation factor IF-2 [Bacillota bacterium]CDE50576.1 translation initiation factor IF-2 [Firmicutes bacterium CAG:460]